MLKPDDFALTPGAAHIWLCRPDAITDPALLADYRRLLCAEERQRYRRLKLDRVRHEFLVTRALLRTTLSRYRPQTAPAQWRFRRNRYGRPEIDRQATALKFNLSHTQGLIACAVTYRGAIGVDVENTTRNSSTVALAERFFSAPECQALRALPAADQQQRFFDYWTLKEAYIKARGMGLALPLGQFSLSLPAGHSDAPISVAFGPKIHDDPARWRFRLWQPSANHRLALCIERLDDGGGKPPPIGLAYTVPLSRMMAEPMGHSGGQQS